MVNKIDEVIIQTNISRVLCQNEHQMNPSCHCWRRSFTIKLHPVYVGEVVVEPICCCCMTSMHVVFVCFIIRVQKNVIIISVHLIVTNFHIVHVINSSKCCNIDLPNLEVICVVVVGVGGGEIDILIGPRGPIVTAQRR